MFEVTGSSAGGAAAACGAGDGWSGGEYRTRTGPRAPHDRGRRGGRRRASGGRLPDGPPPRTLEHLHDLDGQVLAERRRACLLYTSDAADDLLCVDLGGRRII